MKIVIITPEKIVFAADVYEAIIPTTVGEVGFLDHHVPYLAALKAGMISIKKNPTDQDFDFLAVSTGIVEFSHHTLTLLVETAEHGHEIDLALATEARDRAEKLRHQKTQLSTIQIASLTAKLEKELARIKVATRYRRRQP